MFDIGLSELVVLLVLFIVLIQPKDYVTVIKRIAQFYRKLTLYWKKLLNQIDFYD